MMPLPGKSWRHVIFSTHGSWLPGDPRGWRSRHHKRHSSGDYKQPPPEDEHEGLHRYSRKLCPEAITIPPAVRSVVGRSMLAVLASDSHQVLAVSIGGQHVHLLVELPHELSQVKRIIGGIKNEASRKVRSSLPGRVWAGGGKFKLIRDYAHHCRVFSYILEHAKEGAWMWSFR